MDVVSLAGGALVGGGVVGLGAAALALTSKLRRLEREITELKARTPAPAVEVPADAWSVVALLKLTSRDSLDALTRLSPDAALAVVKELMPQLFTRQVG